MRLKPEAGAILSDGDVYKIQPVLADFYFTDCEARVCVFMYVPNFSVPLLILCFSLSVVKELVVSAGDSVEVTLPENEVQLNAFVLPEPPPRKASLGILLRACDAEMTNRRYVKH